MGPHPAKTKSNITNTSVTHSALTVEKQNGNLREHQGQQPQMETKVKAIHSVCWGGGGRRMEVSGQTLLCLSPDDVMALEQGL